MIRSFRHKGLEAFFLTGSLAGISPQHALRLRLQLGTLDAAVSPADMAVPGWRLHRLQGNLKEHYAVTVSGNWRLTFRFLAKGDVDLVDYLDYH